MASNGDGAARRDQTSGLQLLVYSAPAASRAGHTLVPSLALFLVSVLAVDGTTEAFSILLRRCPRTGSPLLRGTANRLTRSRRQALWAVLVD